MTPEKTRKKLMILPLPKLVKKTDKIFQLRRRLEEADKNGICWCISCGSYHHYKKMDGGHFIQRAHNGVRYDWMNCWPQCKKCNHYLHGNHAKYRERLIKKVGEDEVRRMEGEKDLSHKTWWRGLVIEVYMDSKEIVKKLKEAKQ